MTETDNPRQKAIVNRFQDVTGDAEKGGKDVTREQAQPRSAEADTSRGGPAAGDRAPADTLLEVDSRPDVVSNEQKPHDLTSNGARIG